MSRPRVIWLLILGGFAVRLLLLFTTIGTTDVIFWTMWSNLVEKRGIAAAYAATPMLNHPPLSLAILHMLRLMANGMGIELTNLLRLMQIAADGISLLALLAIARRLRSADPWWLALYFFLTPVAIFVSGFHCNTDSTMLMFTLVGLALFLQERDIEAGAVLALAAGIKVPALLPLPFVVVAAKGRAWRVVTGFLLASLAIWTTTVARGGAIVIKNIFGYPGMTGSWGLPALTRAVTTAGVKVLEPVTDIYLKYGQSVLLLALAAIGAVFVWRQRDLQPEESRREVLRVAPLCFLAVLFFAPGFGIQYLVWPLPFIPFLFGRRGSLAWSLLSSTFMFAIYTYWSGGLPWWFADATQHRPGEAAMVWLISIIWLMTGVFFGAGMWMWLRGRGRSASGELDRPRVDLNGGFRITN